MGSQHGGAWSPEGMFLVTDISSSFRDRCHLYEELILHLSNGDELYPDCQNNNCLLVGEFICHNDQNPNSKKIKNSTKINNNNNNNNTTTTTTTTNNNNNNNNNNTKTLL